MSPRPRVPGGPYLVVGLARAGIAAVRALCELAGPEHVRACDRDPAGWSLQAIEQLRAEGVQIDTGSEGLAALESVPRPGLAVKSPGVPFKAPVLARAVELGVPVVDELELGWRLGAAPLVSVTGTNGKSTVCSLLAAIADAAGTHVPVVGNTEFGPPLSVIAKTRAERLVCETSSYQLEGCPCLLPSAALLTNLRPDHMARHSSMESYAACKRRLFVRGDRSVPLALLNADDVFGHALAREVSERGGRVVRYGRDPAAEYRLLDCGWTLRSGWVEARTPDGEIRVDTRLPGPHNAHNALAALAAARSLGFGLEPALRALATAPGVPGRFEVIDEGQPFDVIVDFAHTPDAVEAVLGTVRAIAHTRPGARVHAIQGDSGNRPTALRVPLGAAAGRLADRVIVTEGNLQGEPLAASVEPLLRGARSAGRAGVELVLGRREAIRHALATAGERDLVVVLGRGVRSVLRKTSLGDEVAFDDRVVAREELLSLLGATDQSRTATM